VVEADHDVGRVVSERAQLTLHALGAGEAQR
jgi:hypothetical protein